jgi:molybdate transport system substrate-binding protein
VVFLLALACVVAARAGSVSVAAAANLTYVLDALDAEFQRVTPHATVTITLGASGSLSTQIQHGAPFDVFLSADVDYPRRLAEAGFADGTTLQTFAVGRLVLWTTRADLDPKDIGAVVKNATVRKLAIAQPKTAPYGRAAQAALEKLGLWPAAQAKLVTGENISQTAQFVDTGNADAGFVALSLLTAPRLRDRGHWTEVAPGLYRDVPLDHAAVLTAHGKDNALARQYLAFLHSPAAEKILRQFGYGLPKS